MNKHSNPSRDALREKVIGLGERSIRKSYYPELLRHLSELERFKALLDESPDAILVTQSATGRIIDANRSASERFGKTSAELLTLSLQELVSAETARNIQAWVADENQREREGHTIATDIIRPDGSMTPVEMTVRPALFSDAGYAIIVVRDITERKKAEEALEASEKRFRSMADNISQLAWMANETGWIFWYNKRWYDYTGTSFEEMQGWGWQKVHHPDHVERVVEKLKYCFKNGQFWEDTFPLRAKEGHYRWFLSRAVPIKDDSGKVVEWFGTNTDITEMREMRDEISQLAHHDDLSGLPNRRLFQDVAVLELAEAKRNAKKLALFYMDLDQFKAINDTFGHEVGDTLLKEVAQRLRSVVRSSDFVARLGGDEFTLLVSGMDDAQYASEVANKILTAMREPFTLNGHELNVSTSVGISIYPDDGNSLDTLLRYADIAMYHAKARGRNMAHFYSPEINTRSVERAKFENDLYHAVKRDEFRLFFQPVIELKRKKIVSAEALLRWEHPARGLLLPRHFFGAVEDAGLMMQVEEWVLKNVGKQIRVWHDQEMYPPLIAVNLSAQQFQDAKLVTRVSEITERGSLGRQCIEIEITESAAMRNIEISIKQMRELKKMGVEIMIDDFGSGYSSLNELKRLPIQKLKLDISFIRGIAKNANDRKIVTAVILLAHSLNLKVVAEGVENEEQLSFLRVLGCDEVQGNYFSEPLPGDQFKKLLAAA